MPSGKGNGGPHADEPGEKRRINPGSLEALRLHRFSLTESGGFIKGAVRVGPDKTNSDLPGND